MRTRNSFLNVVSNCVCYIVLMLSGFIIRKTFAEVLGFKPEGILQSYGPDGHDHLMMTIIRRNLNWEIK